MIPPLPPAWVAEFLLQTPFHPLLSEAEASRQPNPTQSRADPVFPQTAATKSFPSSAAFGLYVAWRENASGIWAGKKKSCYQRSIFWRFSELSQLSASSYKCDIQIQVKRKVRSTETHCSASLHASEDWDLPHSCSIALHFPTLRDHNWQLGFVIRSCRHVLGTDGYITLHLIKTANPVIPNGWQLCLLHSLMAEALMPISQPRTGACHDVSNCSLLNLLTILPWHPVTLFIRTRYPGSSSEDQLNFSN